MDEERFRQAPEVTERQLDSEIFLAHPEFGTIHQLNAVGAAVWRRLAEPATLDEIVALLREAFPDVSAEEIEEDVDVLIEDLLDEDLIVICE